MSIAAWIYDSTIVIKNDRQAAALEAIRASFDGDDCLFAVRAREAQDFPAFLEAIFFTTKPQDGGLMIDGGDIDIVTDGLMQLLDELAPFVEAGGTVEIRDEEGQNMTFAYNGEAVEIDFSE